MRLAPKNCESGGTADTPDLGSGAFRRKGSSPFSRRLPSVLKELPVRKEQRRPEYGLHERGNSSVVERHLAKVDVAGPTPVSRSYNRRFGTWPNRLFFCLMARGIAGFHLLLF